MSATRFLKQIPSDLPYFVNLGNVGMSLVSLNYFVPDVNASVTSYASGQVAGQMVPSTVSLNGTSPLNNLFRDMGKTVVSSGRTFRRVQLLSMNNPDDGTQGVDGGLAPTGQDDADYQCFFFETGANGTGVPSVGPFVRYG